jgi:hypothetical protein
MDFGAEPLCFANFFVDFVLKRGILRRLRGKSGSVFVDKTQTKYVYRLSVRTSGRPRAYNKEEPREVFGRLMRFLCFYGSLTGYLSVL